MTKSLKRLLLRIVRRWGRFIAVQVGNNAAYPATGPQQVLLAEMHRQHLRQELGPRRFQDVGFQLYSQSDDDGILLYLFSILGPTNRIVVELCAGDGIECQATNLILNHKWNGILFDGNPVSVQRGRDWFYTHRSALVCLPEFTHAWITRDNVNDLVAASGIGGEVDLFSLDIDGNDYWVWDALTVIKPRVVVAEYNPILGADRSITIPYHESFNAYQYPMFGWLPNYCGASLRALTKLAGRKGYRLVGTNISEFNAFFVRDDLKAAEIPEVSVESCFANRFLHRHHEARWNLVKNLPWQQV
jgi:hypothetical protein